MRFLAWKIPWTEEPGGLQSMGSQRVGHHRGSNTFPLVCGVCVCVCMCACVCVHVYTFFRFSSLVGHHEILSTVPRAVY